MNGPKELSYKRSVLHGCSAFEIVSCEWTDKSVSTMHNHGWSQCVVLVQEGVFENRVDFGLKTELSVVEPGQIIFTPLGCEHEIRCLSKMGKTLHVYTPKIESLIEEGNFFPRNLAALRADIDFKLAADPIRWSELEQILKQITEASISTHSPLFMNQLFSGIFAETLAADKIVSQTRTTMATYEASPAFTAVELEVIDKLGEVIGWRSTEREGIGIPGGSAANIMAVHCARQQLVPEYRKRGSSGEKFKVFCSQEAHYSMKKACLATGIGTDALVEVSSLADGSMDPEDLGRKVERSKENHEIPLLVCATAGTTVLGAFDPIDKLAEVCERQKVWLHVDGAWGGPAIFSDRARKLVKGIERADSVTFDAHKLFGASLTCSFFLNRHHGLLLEANDVSGGEYIFHSREVIDDRGRMSWQCGRGAGSLSFWTLWKNQGTAGLGKFVDRLFEVRDESVAWIKTQPRLELIADPQYLNLCVKVLTPQGHSDSDWSRIVRDRMKSENFAMVNFSKNKDGTFLRLILAHPKIELEHVKQILLQALAIV